MEEFFEKFINSLGYPNASNRKLIAARIRNELGVAAPVDEAPPAAPPALTPPAPPAAPHAEKRDAPAAPPEPRKKPKAEVIDLAADDDVDLARERRRSGGHAPVAPVA